MNWVTGWLKVGCNLGQHCLVLTEMRREQTSQCEGCGLPAGVLGPDASVVCNSTWIVRPCAVVQSWVSTPWRDGQHSIGQS